MTTDERYTVKEILNLIIIPDLEELKRDLHQLRLVTMTPAQVEKQFGELYQSRKARGFKTYELVLGGVGLVLAAVGSATPWLIILAGG